MINKIKKILSHLLTLVIIILALIFIAPKLLGYNPTAVLSGSMEPKYPVGSLIFVKKVNPINIVKDDIITYSMGEGNTAVTHRVIAVNTEEKTFQTKGDANNVADGTAVSYSRIIGKASTFAIPIVGYISVYMTQPLGLLIIGGIILILIATSFMGETKKKGENQNEKQKIL